MNRDNRNVKAAFETAFNSPDVSVVDITEPTRGDWFESLATASPPAVIAFFAGVCWGRALIEFGVVVISANLSSLTLGFTFALVVYLFVFVFHTLATATRYYAAREQVEETPADSFIGTGASHNQHRLLTGEMKKLMKTFARQYPAKRTLGINRWENGSPFTRAEYQRLMAYLETIQAVERAGRGRVLSAFGLSKLEAWAAGNFDDSPHPGSGALSPA